MTQIFCNKLEECTTSLFTQVFNKHCVLSVYVKYSSLEQTVIYPYKVNSSPSLLCVENTTQWGSKEQIVHNYIVHMWICAQLLCGICAIDFSEGRILSWGSEGRKGDTICHEGCYSESVRNSVNHLKCLSSILPGLLFPVLWFAYLLRVPCSFNGHKLMSLMPKELQHYMFFPHWETVSKNQKRRVREQVCLNTCLGFIDCPERTPKHHPTTGTPMSICSSQGPRFSEKGIQVHPSHPLFPCKTAYVSPCTQPAVLAREWWGSSPGCSCLLSLVLHPPVACGIRPRAPLSPLQPEQCSAGGAWAEGLWERRKVEGHTPFSLLQSRVRAVTLYPSRIFTSCCK